jgi:hypothetical protein
MQKTDQKTGRIVEGTSKREAPPSAMATMSTMSTMSTTATHGNPWQHMACHCWSVSTPWGIVAACWSARSKTGEIKIRFFGAQKLPWCWHMLTLVHSGILYTVYSSHFIILLYFLFFCISWSIYQVLSSGHIRSIQTSTQHASSESNVWHGMAAWPVPSEAKAAPTLSGRS